MPAVNLKGTIMFRQKILSAVVAVNVKGAISPMHLEVNKLFEARNSSV
jgi:hypothetical protein